MNILELSIEGLRRRLHQEPPPSTLIEEAGEILDNWPRSSLPDWVEALAEGYPDHYAAVIEVARADEEQDHASQLLPPPIQ